MSAITEATFPHRPSTAITYGLPFAPLLKQHLDRLGATTAFVLVSGSLARHHPAEFQKLRRELGERLVGAKIGIEPHSKWSELLDIAKEVERCNPDAFVTLGGGSACDTTKVLAVVDSNRPRDGKYTHEYLEALSVELSENKIPNPPKHPVLCIPTTLSAAEYSAFAGCTDDRTGQKTFFAHADMAPKVVVLDGALARLTPEWVWLSTGVRAIDHCVETICSPQCDAEAERNAAGGLAKLVSGLLASRSGADSEDARLTAHLGARSAMDAPCRNIPLGGSHAIGHQLGPLGVSHGHTSCVMCPWIMRYNKAVNADRQAIALDVIWSAGEEVRRVLEKRRVKKDEADLCDVLDGIFRELGMPRTLKEVGVGPDKFDELAEKSLLDRWSATNPRPLVEKEQILEVLRMAA